MYMYMLRYMMPWCLIIHNMTIIKYSHILYVSIII